MSQTLFALGLGWTAFGVVHSALLERRVRALLGRRVGRWAGYRLFYNLTACGTLAGMIAWAWSLQSPVVWEVHGPAAWTLRALQLAGLFLGLGSAWQLGFLEFVGLRKARPLEGDAAPPLIVDGLYRVCRHPMGLGFLLMVWGTPRMSTAYLASACCLTTYLCVGTWLEERALVAEFGDAYRRYRASVPCLLPWPRRALSTACVIDGDRGRS